MNKPVMYLAHDPLGNSEAQVVEYDPTLLAKAEQQGIIFIAVDAAGDRQIVSAEDVKPPSSETDSLMLVQPVYVDTRMQAVVDVFDALEAFIFPEAEALNEEQSVNALSQSRKIMPEAAFKNALAVLKKIVQGGES